MLKKPPRKRKRKNKLKARPRNDDAPAGYSNRTCLGCRRTDVKEKMVRLCAGDSGVAVDFDFRMDGRGGYLHRRRECLDGFVNAKVKEFRSLRRRIDRDERIKLVEVISKRLAESGRVE